MRVFRTAFAATVCAAATLLGPGAIFAQYPARPVRIIVRTRRAAFTIWWAVCWPASFPSASVRASSSRTAGWRIGDRHARSGDRSPGRPHHADGRAEQHRIQSGLYEKLPYDPIRDFIPVGLAYTFPYIMVARGGLPQSNVGEIIAAARQNPDSLSIGSPGAAARRKFSERP